MNNSEIVSHREEHRQLARANRYAANIIFNILEPYLDFKSLLDLGCGTGIWMQAALRKSDRTVFGVEVEEFGPEELLVPANLIINASLAEKIDLRERFDLVICLETAEHISPAAADDIVQNCTRHSDVVLFSAAIPGQGGLHHINEQPPEYWAKRFNDNNFEVIDLIRPQIWDDEMMPAWYRQNMLLFVSREKPDLIAEMRSDASKFASPLAKIHPHILRTHADFAAQRERELQAEIGRLNGELREKTNAQHRETELQAEINRLNSELQEDSLRADLYRLESKQLRDTIDNLQQSHGDLIKKNQTAEHLLAVAVRGRLDSETRSEQSRQLASYAEGQLRAVYESTSWRVTAPARWTSAGLRRLAGQSSISGLQPNSLSPRYSDPALEPTAGMPEGEPLFGPVGEASKPSARDTRIKVTFVSGEPSTPGHAYRVANMAQALPELHYDVAIVHASDARDSLSTIAQSAVVWIWRAPWSPELAELMSTARAHGAKLVFDVDDLMFRPELATNAVIDGIRSQGFTEGEIAEFYDRVRKTMLEADLCVAPTLRLAREIIQSGKPAAVVPNGYASGAQQRAAEAVALAGSDRGDGLIRIGYAAGSRTHQRDFSLVVPALVKVFASTPSARLVLTQGTVDVSEFPALLPFSSQIEWREFVPFERMLAEYARYDINIVPLEVGNRFCEAKSELKYFEAALVGVPTVASPTEPYAAAIRHGETGLLVEGDDKWHEAIMSLVRDPELGRRMATAARREVLWNYGPERRAYSVRRTIGRLLSEPAAAAGLFQAQASDDGCRPLAEITVPEYSILFENKTGRYSRVSIIMPCYNYANYIEEALESVLKQTVRDIDIIIIDDCSTDNSVAVTEAWLKKNQSKFNRVALLKNKVNSKLGASRNAAIEFAQTELFLPLDPDNLLEPNCIELCLNAIDATGAAVAYPKIESFGDTGGQIWYISEPPWQPDRFRAGNYIDAMALIRTNCWRAVGGYEPFLYGWEDYQLWCRFVEHGFFGINVPQVTARYRYHGNQMIKTLTIKNTKPLLNEMQARHPWTYPVS